METRSAPWTGHLRLRLQFPEAVAVVEDDGLEEVTAAPMRTVWVGVSQGNAETVVLL